MDVTVLICTRDRRAMLERALGSIASARVPAGLAWELVVVDNGSADGTAAAAEGFAGRLPIRVVREERAGLSHARNRGVEAARGGLIVWTDDDVLVDAGWLEAHCRAAAAHPEAAFFGGRVDPVLEPPTPGWLRDNLDLLEHLVAGRDFGETPFAIRGEDDRLPFGANFAVRAADQRRHPYDPNLGVSPTLRRSGEETTVLRALLREGREGRWVPDSRVLHLFPARRQTFAYVLQHYRAYGETAAYLAAASGRRGSPWVTRAGWRALHDLGKSGVAIAVGRLLGRSRLRLRHTCYYGFNRGQVDYWLGPRTASPARQGAR